jgi:carboxylesterase
MSRTRWADWYGELETAFTALREDADVVVVAGLSMGGALALNLAEDHGSAVDGLVLVNPAVRIDDPRLKALPVVRWLVPWLPPVGNDIAKAGVTEDAYNRIPPHALASSLAAYRSVSARLASVTQPILLFRSPQDHVVPASSSAQILRGVSSTDVTEVLCENSFHVATLDNDAPMIFKGSLDFLHRIAADRGVSR